MEAKPCPKCNGEMEKDKHLASYTEVTLVKQGQFTGERINTFCYKNCGYIELYREKRE